MVSLSSLKVAQRSIHIFIQQFSIICVAAYEKHKRKALNFCLLVNLFANQSAFC